MYGRNFHVMSFQVLFFQGWVFHTRFHIFVRMSHIYIKGIITVGAFAPIVFETNSMNYRISTNRSEIGKDKKSTLHPQFLISSNAPLHTTPRKHQCSAPNMTRLIFFCFSALLKMIIICIVGHIGLERTLEVWEISK